MTLPLLVRIWLFQANFLVIFLTSCDLTRKNYAFLGLKTQQSHFADMTPIRLFSSVVGELMTATIFVALLDFLDILQDSNKFFELLTTCDHFDNF